MYVANFKEKNTLCINSPYRFPSVDTWNNSGTKESDIFITPFILSGASK